MQKTQIQPEMGESPMEKGMATHCYPVAEYWLPSILVWRIPWTEETSGLQRSPWGHRVRHDWVTNTHIFDYVIDSNYLYSLFFSL